jgi:GNAT superfamily N-acetyltransferase
MALEIRPAGPEDQASVVEFCSRIWEGHDYIPKIWEEWLSDQEGVLLVALWEGKPVSVVRASFYTPGEAWLEGMRVDPDYQGRGIATAVFTELMEAVKKRGARVARLLTSWRNVEVHRMCDHLGFELLFRGRSRFRPLEIGVPSGLRSLDEGEFTLARDLLARRRIGARRTATFFEVTHNLYSVGGGVWLSWGAGRLREHLAAGHVWVWEEGGAAKAVAVVTPHRRGRPGLYIVGLIEGIGRACSALLDALARRESIPEPDGDYVPSVRLAIPLSLSRIHRSAAAAGYRFPRRWRAEMLLYERSLEQ